MRSVVVHALLAVVGLGLAYQTWTREEDEERPEGEVVVLECVPDGVDELRIETPTSLVRVEPKSGDAGRYYWIETQRKRPEKKDEPAAATQDGGVAPTPAASETAKPAAPTAPQPADAKDAGVSSEEAEKKRKEEEERKKREEEIYLPKRFVANAKLTEYLAKIAPLRAARSLGEIPESEFEPYGFHEVGTRLHVGCGERKVALDVGGRTFGSGLRYLRDPASKQVYLFEASVTSDLESAQYKFMQVELLSFPTTEVDEVVVRAHGAEKRLVQRDRSNADLAQWVDKAEPDRRNETYGNWFDRLSRLRVTSYLAEGAEPGSDVENAGGITPVVTIEYFLEGKPKDELEIVRVDAAGQALYYARTGATRAWTRIYDSLAKEVERDAALVVGVEQPEEPASASPAAPAPAGGPAAPAAPGTPRAGPTAPAAPARPHAPLASPHASPSPAPAAPAPAAH